MRDALDRVSWPARRWLCDLLVGRHAYSRNVRPVIAPNQWNSSSSGGRITVGHQHPFRPFDQERAS